MRRLCGIVNATLAYVLVLVTIGCASPGEREPKLTPEAARRLAEAEFARRFPNVGDYETKIDESREKTEFVIWFIKKTQAVQGDIHFVIVNKKTKSAVFLRGR